MKKIISAILCMCILFNIPLSSYAANPLVFRDEPIRSFEESIKLEQTEKIIEDYCNNISNSRTVTYYKELSITPILQQESFYCAAATTHLLLKHINGYADPQSSIASSLGCTVNSGPSTSEIKGYINARISGSTYDNPHLSNGATQLRNAVQYSVDKGRPVICQLKTGTLPGYSSQKNTNHYVLAIGARNGFSSTDSVDNIIYIDTYDTTTNNVRSYGRHEIATSELTTAIENHYLGYIVRSN